MQSDVGQALVFAYSMYDYFLNNETLQNDLKLFVRRLELELSVILEPFVSIIRPSLPSLSSALTVPFIRSSI